MKEKLKSFIDDLFANAPKNQATLDTKEEFYVNACDKYDDYIAQGKDKQAAYDLTLSSIGDISEVLISLGSPSPALSSVQTSQADGRVVCNENNGIKVDARSIKNIEINWVSGSVKILTHNGSQIEVSESAKDGAAPKNPMICFINDGKLTVKFQKNKGFFEKLTTMFENKELTVLIPQSGFYGEKLSLDTVSADSIINSVSFKDFDFNNASGDAEISNCSFANKLSVNNISGNINIRNIQSRKLDFSTASGDVKLSGCMLADKLSLDSKSGDTVINNAKAAKFDLSTISGDIVLTGIETYKLKLNSVSGQVNASGSFNEINGETMSGDYSIASTAVLNKISFESVSGNLDLKIPENKGFTAEFEGVSGDFATDFPIMMKNKKKIFGDGSALYNFSVVSGDVTVNHI